MNVINFYLLGTPSALYSRISSACKVDYTNSLRENLLALSLALKQQRKKKWALTYG